MTAFLAGRIVVDIPNRFDFFTFDSLTCKGCYLGKRNL